jgi:DNA primase
MISPATIGRIIDTARIEDVVGDFVRLRRRGANYVGLCPFHNEKTPSFSVNPARNIYKCFGCGKAGQLG